MRRMAESFWIPREEFAMPEGAQETMLGYPKGSIRQYRLGTMHIREYKEGFEVHWDKVDPRKDPLGHLAKDAPELLVLGVGGVIIGGIVAYFATRR